MPSGRLLARRAGTGHFTLLYTLIGAIILSINIQVGLNVHLYDDIGDASSSLRGLMSIFLMVEDITKKLDAIEDKRIFRSKLFKNS